MVDWLCTTYSGRVPHLFRTFPTKQAQSENPTYSAIISTKKAQSKDLSYSMIILTKERTKKPQRNHLVPFNNRRSRRSTGPTSWPLTGLVRALYLTPTNTEKNPIASAELDTLLTGARVIYPGCHWVSLPISTTIRFATIPSWVPSKTFSYCLLLFVVTRTIPSMSLGMAPTPSSAMLLTAPDPPPLLRPMSWRLSVIP